MATVKDVALRAGVSLGSVSNYLNGKRLKPKTASRIKKAMDELDYHQNIIASGLKKNKSMSIGIVVNSLTDFFSMSIVSEIENYVENYGYSIIICDCREDKQRFEEKIEFLLNRSIDAIVVFHQDESSPMLEKVVEQAVPIVAIDAPIHGIQSDVVLVNNYESSREGVVDLINRGYQKIGIISGQPRNYISRERQGGYEDALREHDLPINQQYIWQGNYTIQSGVEGTTRLLTKHPEIEALFVINYYMSLGALKALRQNFSKRHVEMLIFDHFFVNDIFYPSISSIEQPVATIGKTAGRLLIERLVKGKEGNYETIYCKNSLRT